MDITPFLAPISVERPCGEDLSFSPEIDTIQEMRREDDPTLDQGEWVAALKSADWPGVARTCEGLLARRSKDLRVAGWLADAWARLRGFEGLADGLDLSAGLVDAFWDGLHPLPEDGEQEQRIGNLRWLANRVETLVTSIALVAHDGRRLSLAAIATARSQRLTATGNGGTGGSSEPEDGAEPSLTLEAVWRDVTSAGREAAASRRQNVTRARAALVSLQAAADARLGDDAPSFVAARGALDKARDELARLERECGFDEGVEETGEAPVPAASAVPSASPAPAAARAPRVSGPIESRVQALEQLRLVAAWFRASEPHSPVAYLADKAVAWAEMPLHEWLRAVVKDGGSLAHVEELLGIGKPG